LNPLLVLVILESIMFLSLSPLDKEEQSKIIELVIIKGDTVTAAISFPTRRLKEVPLTVVLVDETVAREADIRELTRLPTLWIIRTILVCSNLRAGKTHGWTRNLRVIVSVNKK